MPTFLLAVTVVLSVVGGVLVPGASPLTRQIAPSHLQTAEITVGGVPLTVELAYQPADSALGLGYRTFRIDVDSADEDTPGFVDLSIDGPLLFVRASM